MKNYLLTLTLALSLFPAGAASAQGPIQKEVWGKTAQGETVERYTLTNRNGLKASVMTYGAVWISLICPDKDGNMGDVLLGFDDLAGYLGDNPYFGAVVGRVGNRIAKGRFSLDGKDYILGVNNGPNHLHGGFKGLDKVVWSASSEETAGGPSVKLSYLDKDGSNGYPGNLKIQVRYTLTDSNEMRIDYDATTDKATPVNLTNHAYFNLGTPAHGDILHHLVQLEADQFTPVDDTLIPTGQILPVASTPMDFREPTAIAKNVENVGKNPTGFDHNYVVRSNAQRVARVVDPSSGRWMEVRSDQPGLQFYTGNFLDGSNVGKGKIAYKRNYAFCMETQHFPDSINHPQFPNTVLRPGETYHTWTSYKFGSDKSN